MKEYMQYISGGQYQVNYYCDGSLTISENNNRKDIIAMDKESALSLAISIITHFKENK